MLPQGVVASKAAASAAAPGLLALTSVAQSMEVSKTTDTKDDEQMDEEERGPAGAASAGAPRGAW